MPMGPIERITVLGDGQMGLVCAALLAEQPPDAAGGVKPIVTLWGHHAREVGSLARTRTSERLNAFMLPDSVRVIPDDAEAVRGAELIVAAVPSQHARSVFKRLADAIPGDAAVVSVAKGIEKDTLLRPSEVALEALENSDRPVAALSGPTIAAELARCMPATMVAASEDERFAERVQQLFNTRWLRVYTNTDLVGVELAGAAKNVIAIAAGVLDGLQAGYNAKSALLARGLAEIARLGAAMGAKAETFFGVAGVGDLATTCFSPEGRNRSCGEALGRGESLKDYLARTKSVVEGVETSRSVVALAKRHGVDMPIAGAVHAVLFEGLDPIHAIAGLMSREPKAERVG